MPTRDEVITAIETINDNGNNTAQEVRTVLTALLDYTENEEVTPPAPTPTTDWFSFASAQPIEDNATGSNLMYSIRGVENTFANLTFSLKVSDNSNNNIFSFLLQEDHARELFEIIERILPTLRMPFVIPIVVSVNQDNARPVPLPFSTTISFQEIRITTGNSQEVRHIISFDINPWSNQGESEFPITEALAETSVCFHASDRMIVS